MDGLEFLVKIGGWVSSGIIAAGIYEQREGLKNAYREVSSIFREITGRKPAQTLNNSERRY